MSVDEDLEGKKILLRTDLNLPVENGEPRETIRFKRYMKTVEKLSREGAKTVVMAHQGRPARKDFISMEPHAEMMSENLSQDVELVRSFFGPGLEDTVTTMEEGDVSLLENIRFLSEELRNARPRQHAQGHLVEELSPYFDLFVNDAFSAAHRSHASMVGFTSRLRSRPGPVMRRELENCQAVKERFDGGILVLGGEKPSDIIGMMNHMIEDVDRVLLGGVPGELALMTQGHSLGRKEDWIAERNLDAESKQLESLLDEYGCKIQTPEDLRTGSDTYRPEEVPEDSMTWDIGEETVEKYRDIIEKAEAALMKGPMGAFEKHPQGSRRILEKLSDSSVFTVLGGGHTSSLVQRFSRDIEDFSHVSIAGGAFVRYMSGEELPAVEALRSQS